MATAKFAYMDRSLRDRLGKIIGINENDVKNIIP
jgi:hypothetical protein